MDIRKHAVAETGRLHLQDAAGAELFDDQGRPVVAVIYGPGSKQYARANAKRSNRAMERMRKKGKVEQTAEELAAENADFLADITADLENLSYDGLEGRAKHLAVYKDLSIGFIADQVAKYGNDWANFSKPSTSI